MNSKKMFFTNRYNLHPRWLIAVALFMAVAGCGAQTTGSTPGVSAAPEPAVVEQSQSEKMGAGDDKVVDKKNVDEKSDETPDPKYKVLSEAQPGMEPELIMALEKVMVSPPPKSMKTPRMARATIETSKGPITVELNGQAAPLHVKNFLYLSKIGFYDATVFHRYEPGFVIQGGDPLTKNPALKAHFGKGGPGYQVPRERNALKHSAMVLAAARSQDPDSAGSQFYFTLDAASFLDEGDGYTVFGKVVDGKENALKLRAGDKLEKVEIVAPKP